MRVLLPLLIIAAGVGLARQLYATKPTAKKRQPKETAPLVTVAKIPKVTREVQIRAMGTMMPELTVALRSRVTGRAVWVAEEFVPGGLFRKGEAILRLDPSDFKIAIQKQESLVRRAAADLELEKGRGYVASEELRLMEKAAGRRIGDRELALRTPQKAKAEADLATARADLAQVKLSLERTVLRAPFNCVVKVKAVERGGQVSPQDNLATLDGTDAGWVEAAVPLDRLGWIRFPRGKGEEGSEVLVRPISGQERRGRVIRLLGDVNESRMAKVLVEVADPLGLANPEEGGPLLTGSYLSVVIKGKPLENVLPVPRSAVREGDSIWVADQGALSIREIRSAWSDRDFVYVSKGLTKDDALIVSELTAPVDGMRLRMPGMGSGASEGPRSAGTGSRRPGDRGGKGVVAGTSGDASKKGGKEGKAADEAGLLVKKSDENARPATGRAKTGDRIEG